jgi:hypothetical protein
MVVFLIYNSVYIEKIQKTFDMGLGQNSASRQSGSCHFQMPTAGPPVRHPEQGTPVRAAYSPVPFDAGVHCRPEGPAQTSLSSAYKSDGR